MPSSRRVSAPKNRIYKSDTPKRQTTLVTPKKSVRKNITYGKCSSAKKTTLAQVWGWEKILNEQLDEEQREFSKEIKNDDAGEQKRADLEHSSYNSGKHDTHMKTRRVARRKTVSNVIQEKEDAQISIPKPSNIRRRSNTADDKPSTEIKTLNQVPDQTVESRNSMSKVEQTEEKIKEVSQDVELAHKNISLSRKHRPLIGIEELPQLYNPSKSLSLISKNKKDDRALLPQTPKGDSGIEVPSSQSLATPMSLLNRSSARFRESLKDKLFNTPIPFKLSKNSSVSPEIMDTFDPEYSTLGINHDKDFSLEIKDTLNFGSDFSFIDRINSTPVKLSSPLKFVKFALTWEQTGYVQVPSSPLVNTEAELKNLNRQISSEFKTEILDSEAESEVEFEDSKDIVPVCNTSCEKNLDEINQENLATNHQVLPGPEEPKMHHHSPQLMEPETYYGETFGPETQYELSVLNTCFPPKTSSNSEEKGFTEIPKKSGELGFVSGLDQEKREYLLEKTQYIESQRLSTQYLSHMAPRTGESDVFISIDAHRVAEILSGIRDHETRRYKLPPPVCRAWLYERHPKCAVKYMAEIGPAKRPGDIINETGVGNKAFNLKKSCTSWAAYEILNLYELADPLTLEELKAKEWLKAAPKPMKWIKIPPAVVDELVANLKSSVFDKTIYFKSPISSSRNNQPAELGKLESTDESSQMTAYDKSISCHSRNDNVTKVDFIHSHIISTPKKESFPSSQATTVDLTQALTPMQNSVDMVCETPTYFDLASNSSTLPTPQPIRLSHNVTQEIQMPFSMASSQILTESQLLPESLLNDFIFMAPPIIPSSEDNMNI